jgi:TetR/AcrR family transcriptional repressor of mexJK operon
MFVKQGYKKTTLEAIIAASGGSRETIYKTFGGKQGLFRAIIADVGDTFVGSILDVEISALAPQEGLTRIANNLMAIWATDEVRAMHRVVLSEGVDAPEIMDAWYRGGPAVALAAITRYLASQRQAGELTLDDPATVATQFMLLLMGELAFPTMSGSTKAFDRKAAVDRTVRLLVLAHSTRRAGDDAEPLRRPAARNRR